MSTMVFWMPVWFSLAANQYLADGRAVYETEGACQASRHGITAHSNDIPVGGSFCVKISISGGVNGYTR